MYVVLGYSKVLMLFSHFIFILFFTFAPQTATASVSSYQLVTIPSIFMVEVNGKQSKNKKRNTNYSLWVTL